MADYHAQCSVLWMPCRLLHFIQPKTYFLNWFWSRKFPNSCDRSVSPLGYVWIDISWLQNHNAFDMHAAATNINDLDKGRPPCSDREKAPLCCWSRQSQVVVEFNKFELNLICLSIGSWINQSEAGEEQTVMDQDDRHYIWSWLVQF